MKRSVGHAVNADEAFVAEQLAQLRTIADNDPDDHRATSAHLQRIILSRLTAAQAATILRHMAVDALEHFGDRTRERTGVTGGWNDVETREMVISAWENSWQGTMFRMRRHAERAGVRVPGCPHFWGEGHFTYLGRRHLARRHGAAA